MYVNDVPREWPESKYLIAACVCIRLFFVYVGTCFWGLVNNAGIMGAGGPVEFVTKSDFEQVMQVNFLGIQFLLYLGWLGRVIVGYNML